MQPDMSWVGVLEHHAQPHARQAARDLRRRDRHLRRDGRHGRPRSRPGCTSAGVGAGDVVGLLSYNCTEFLETIFAANHLGAIAMPINWRLAAPELRYILDHSEARALVCDESLVDLANDATRGMERDARPGRASRRPAPDGWTPLADLRTASAHPARALRPRATTSTG